MGSWNRQMFFILGSILILAVNGAPEMEEPHFQSTANMLADKHTQGPEEEPPIELQQDPTMEPLRDMQDDDDHPNDANIVEEVGQFHDAIEEKEDSSDMQQGGGDDNEPDGSLQEGPTDEDNLSIQRRRYHGLHYKRCYRRRACYRIGRGNRVNCRHYVYRCYQRAFCRKHRCRYRRCVYKRRWWRRRRRCYTYHAACTVCR